MLRITRLCRWLCFVAMIVLTTTVARADVSYVYHEVTGSDTMCSIARQYGVTEELLLDSNATTIQARRGLQPGMILVVPNPKPSRFVKPSTAQTSKQSGRTRRSSRRTGQSSLVVAPSKVNLSLGADSSAASSVSLRSRRQPYSSRSGAAKPSRIINSNNEISYIPAYVPPAPVDLGIGGYGLEVVSCAKSYLGVPYVWGGTDPSGFDCSGYVQYVYKRFGVELPRTADVQFGAGQDVARGAEAPGDLVFFETYMPGPSHVGILVEGNTFIHASSSGMVRISSLAEDYFAQHYLGAKRVLK